MALMVRNPLTASMTPQLSRVEICPYDTLDKIEQTVVMVTSNPADSIGCAKSGRILGHATPRTESGSPRLTKPR